MSDRGASRLVDHKSSSMPRLPPLRFQFQYTHARHGQSVRSASAQVGPFSPSRLAAKPASQLHTTLYTTKPGGQEKSLDAKTEPPVFCWHRPLVHLLLRLEVRQSVRALAPRGCWANGMTERDVLFQRFWLTGLAVTDWPSHFPTQPTVLYEAVPVGHHGPPQINASPRTSLPVSVRGCS